MNNEHTLKEGTEKNGRFFLSHDQFHAELNYQAAMAVAKSMLRSGLISDEEYSQIDTIFLAQYRPFFSTLLAG